VNRGKGVGSTKADLGTTIGLFGWNNLGKLSIFKY
jgi:hypothetical protein